jgi:membrane protein YqaA with SNARE-associated domain
MRLFLQTEFGRLMNWVLAWGDRPSAPIVLVLLTLLEATVFPAPTEALLLTLCISQPKRSWAFGLLAAVGSLLGGIIGYHLGATLYGEFTAPLIGRLGLGHYMPTVAAAYRENMWLALATSGYTPIPYMLYTMMAGAFSLPLDSFAAASFVGRALKFIPIAVLAVLFGPAVRQILQRYAGWAGMGITLLLVGLIAWQVL